MVVKHSRLDRHVHIGKYSRLAHRQAKYKQTKPLDS